MVCVVAFHLLLLTVFSFTLCASDDVFVFRKGATVHLPCPALPPIDSEHISVEWIKNSINICKWIVDKNIGFSSGECDHRFTVTINFPTLSIENVQPSDSGNYICKILRVIPPPSFNKTSSLVVEVEGLSLQLLNSSNISCVHLLCVFETPKPRLVNFTWSLEGQRSCHPFTSYSMNSELRLCEPHWSNGDTITCYANYEQNQIPYSTNITLDFSNAGNRESRHDFPVVFVAIFLIFIVCISFLWTLFCILNISK